MFIDQSRSLQTCRIFGCMQALPNLTSPCTVLPGAFLTVVFSKPTLPERHGQICIPQPARSSSRSIPNIPCVTDTRPAPQGILPTEGNNPELSEQPPGFLPGVTRGGF